MIFRLLRGCVLTGGLLAFDAQAQVIEKKTLTLDGAKSVIAACEKAAHGLKAGGAIAVVDDGGNLIALHRLDGTFAAASNISIGKARTAALFRKPTAAFETTIREGRTPMLALNDFTPLQGGVPIVVDGQTVGAVGMSGAASAAQDEEIASVGAAAVASKPAAPTTNAPPAKDSPKTASASKAALPVEARPSHSPQLMEKIR